MPRPGFYNDNEYRAYPFLYRKTPPTPYLPDATIVDCGIIMGLDSEYDETQHVVYLHAIERTATDFIFVLRTTAPGAATKDLVFTREIDAPEWQTEYTTAAAADKTCAIEPAWEGFLVTGVLTDLAEELAPNTSRVFTPTAYVLEPARIQSLVKAYLRSISVGNYSRVVATIPEECGGPEPVPREIIVNKQCMRGNIRFKEGYNCEIIQTDRNNEIVVTGAIGAGGGEGNNICEEIKLFDEEEPPTGSKLLSGGPACDEIIFTVNGVNYEGSLQLLGGTGVMIKQDPNNENGLVIERIDNVLVGDCGKES